MLDYSSNNTKPKEVRTIMQVKFDGIEGEKVYLVPISTNMPTWMSQLGFGPFGSRPNADNMVYQPGILSTVPSGIPNQNNCTHQNLKGTLILKVNPNITGDTTEIKGVTSHRLAGTELYDPNPLLDHFFKSVDYYGYEVGDQYSWKNEGKESITFTKWYRQIIKRNGRDFYGQQWQYESTHVTAETETTITFSIRKRYRENWAQGTVPIPWSEWTEPQFVGNWTFLKVYASTQAMSDWVKDAVMLELLEARAALVDVCLRAKNYRADYYHCIAQACQSFDKLDMNNIENISQLPQTLNILGEMVTGLKVLDDPTRAVNWLKSAGNLHLWYKYAVKPTVQDVNCAIETAKSLLNKDSEHLSPVEHSATVHHSYDDIEVVCHSRVQVDPYTGAKTCVVKALELLDQAGLSLTPANLADLVPYEFCAGWVTNWNDIKTIWSLSFHSYSYTLRKHISSFKATKEVQYTGRSELLDGTVKAIYYEREVSPTFPVVPLLGKDAWGRHVITAAALLVG